MQKTGTVTFSNGEPSLDGTRLAICDDPSPFVAAGTFLRNLGITGGRIQVTGDTGTIGGVSVFCMTAAAKVAALASASPKPTDAPKAVVSAKRPASRDRTPSSKKTSAATKGGTKKAKHADKTGKSK